MTSTSFTNRMRSASAPSGERGRTSVRLDLTLDVPASPATRLSPAEASALVAALLGTVGLGEVLALGRPSLWAPPAGGAVRRCRGGHGRMG